MCWTGSRFVVPTNPGPYPTTVDADKVIRERQIAEHKAECAAVHQPGVQLCDKEPPQNGFPADVTVRGDR